MLTNIDDKKYKPKKILFGEVLKNNCNISSLEPRMMECFDRTAVWSWKFWNGKGGHPLFWVANPKVDEPHLMVAEL